MSHRVGSSCRPLRRKSHIVYLCRKPLSAAFTVELNAPTVTSKNRRSEDPKEERHAAGCRTARRAVLRAGVLQPLYPGKHYVGDIAPGLEGSAIRGGVAGRGSQGTLRIPPCSLRFFDSSILRRSRRPVQFDSERR